MMIADLHLSQAMLSAQHIRDEDLVVTVSVQVAKIDTHGKPTGLAHGGWPQHLEAAIAPVNPNPIRRGQVAANIQIGQSIFIEVPKGCAERPIV